MRLYSWLLAGSAALAVGCASSSGDDGEAATNGAVTNIPETSVKDQAIGNCWIYVTLGWVESLVLAHSGETLNLSESYLTYLHAFARITNDAFVFDGHGDWSTADFVGEGAELISRYGLMDEAAFIATEANVDRSARQEKANRVIAAALKPGGPLEKKESHRDVALVRRVLDYAFELPPATVQQMTSAFGADLSKTRGKGAVLPTKGFHDPAKMIVAKLANGHAVTLDEAIGELDKARKVSSARDRRERRGPYAWQRVELEDPRTRDAGILRLKKTLNAGFPVPIDWYVAHGSMRMDDGSFHAPIRGEGGWHASLAHDYQIDVGGKVLPVGVPVTDPALLAKTLLPSSKIEFLRMKNSWGREVGPLSARGYTDAMWDYLTSNFERPGIDFDEKPATGPAVSAIIVPPPSWDGATH